MNTEKQLTSKFLDEYLSSCLLVLKILKEATPSNTTQQSTLLLLLNNEKQRCIERYSELYDVANGIERISPNTDGTEIENTLEKQRDELRKSVNERNRNLKDLIDRLHNLQQHINILNCNNMQINNT